MSTVALIGLGYVGLPSAALIARAGHEVYGVDVNEELISELQSGFCRLDESDVKEIVHDALESKRLKVGLRPKEADIFIICVPTPITIKKKPDLTMVKSAVQSISPFVKKGDMVILESTSPIGTTERVIGEELREVGLDPLMDVDICYCPERVFPGNTVNEILLNDRIVGGLTEKAANRARDFYLSFCKGNPLVTTAAAAEFSKLMENTYRDVNIALANVFSHIAEEADVDVADVIAMANKHPRVNVHTPGPGVGGHCIPVDPWFLIDGFPSRAAFLKAAREINDGQVRHFLNRAKSAGLVDGSKVAILGAAYRGDIDDARDSPTILLIDELDKMGFKYATHDPFVTRMSTHLDNSANLTSDLSAALSGASAAFIMTDHTNYQSLVSADFDEMKVKLVIDTRRILSAEVVSDNNFDVISVGL